MTIADRFKSEKVDSRGERDTVQVVTGAAPLDGQPAPVVHGRVAVLNEWYEAVGGAERTLDAMIRAFPDVDAHVLWRDADAVSPHPLQETWLARTPLRGHKALTLPMIPFVWRFARSRRYDVVVSLSHAMNHTARLPVREGGKHLAYVHTPARYLWLPEIDRRRQHLAHRATVAIAKRLELRMSRHVSSYAANSQEVRARIAGFWGRDARVIHPPVRTDFFTPGPVADVPHGGGYLLGVGRWVLYKNFDFMIEVAERAGLPMVIAGGGPGEAELRAHAARAGVEVSFEMRPSDTRIRDLMRGARAFLFPVHEDFGIVPVEAQACGTPVVGLSRGGLLETVVDGGSGHLVPELDAGAFAAAVGRTGELDRAAVRSSAMRFSEARFIAEVRQWVADEQGAGSSGVPAAQATGVQLPGVPVVRPDAVVLPQQRMPLRG